MPTSVLLAVLAAAGLLALAPAFTRGSEGTEDEAAQRTASAARVLSRRRRRRTVPGPHPIKPPRFTGLFRGGAPFPASSAASSPTSSATASPTSRILDDSRRSSARDHPRSPRGRRLRGRRLRGRQRRRGRRPLRTALRRRRQVFLALILLNLVELAGVVLVGPGFWIGFAVSATVFACYLIYLRHLAVVAERRRRARARRGAWLAAEQAAVRREHERRAALRRAALRRLAAERERASREAARPVPLIKD